MLRTVSWVFWASVLAWVAGELWLRTRQYRRSGKAKTTEWRSYGLIVLSIVVGDYLAGAVTHNLRVLRLPLPYSVLLIVAILLLWAGAGFRLWAIHTLGIFFRGAVHVQEGHTVVRSGVYRCLRHPSYAGLLVALIGIGLVFDNILSWVIFVGCPLLSILYRLRTEERLLIDSLGAEYTDYAAQTKRLVPGVW